MSLKIVFIIIFIFIIVSLGSALFHLVKNKDPENSAKTAKALSFRIGLSLLLFIALFISYATGLIKPAGIGARIQQVQQNKLQTSVQVNPQNP